MSRKSSVSSRLLLLCLGLLLVLPHFTYALSFQAPRRNLQEHHDEHDAHHEPEHEHEHEHAHEDQFVDEDGHSHAVELHACTGAALELTGDAKLTVHDVYNAQEYLVTNVELKTCEDIDALRCDPKATICKKWHADVHHDEDIELHYNDFHNGEAHFYAIAEDRDHEISLTVNLTPIGVQDHAPAHRGHTSGHEEKHVEDDGQFHSLELHECSGATLELPEGDALFDVTDVSNAKRYLVTDVELHTCEEIKGFHCRDGAHFCHIWNAHDAEMVMLKHADFPHKEAHLYVEPEDSHHPVSVNVKITDAAHDEHGHVHNTEDHEHHTDPNHPSEEEHHHDHESGVEETHVEADDHTHAFQLHSCSGVELELHGDANLSVHSVFNAKRFLLTNKQLETCEEIAALSCHKDATVCHIWSADHEEEFHIDHAMFAEGKAHVYAEFEDHHKEVSLNLKLVHIGEQAPHNEHAHSVESVIIDNEDIHALEIHSCTEVRLQLKGDATLHVENVFNAHSYLITDIELESCSEILEFQCHHGSNVCHAYEADHPQDIPLVIAEFHNKEAFFYVMADDHKQEISVNAHLVHGISPEVLIADNHEKLDFEHLVFRALMAFALFVIVLGIFFRCYVRSFKRAPFNAPSWCPSICFPHVHSEATENFISQEVRRRENQELQDHIFRPVEV